MKYIFILLFFLPCFAIAQIKGKVIDSNGNPIQGATVNLQNHTTTGTSTNADGIYELKANVSEKYVITVYCLGYQTKSSKIEVGEMPYTFDIQLEQVMQEIEEISIGTTENPANRIMREANRHKKKNGKKYDRHQVDFYSKGSIKLVDMPKKILGKNVDDDKDFMDDLMLDSSRSGIVYLSESISEVWVERPRKFKEFVKASKISGNDRGYSYNTAMGADFDFYANHVFVMENIISPLSDQAFLYYRFGLQQTLESNGQTIFKIRVTPKRDSEPVARGYIYIINDTWEIYAVDLVVKGSSVNQPIIDSLCVKQQYVYDANSNIWIKQSQNIHFGMELFNIKLTGNFNHIFNNYRFVDVFDKDTFGKTLIVVQEESNKMSTDFWEDNRPIVLKEDEMTNYIKKDSLQTVRNSKTYRDSIDRVNNKFKPTDLINGYTYSNSSKKYSIGYSLLSNLDKFSFNAVQGFVADLGIHARKRSANELGLTAFSTDISYGFSDKKTRFSSVLSHRFDSKTPKEIRLEGGSNIAQFNPSNPISPFINMAASLFFKENHIKLYQRDYIRLSYNQRIFPELAFSAGAEYNRRSPLFVHTHYSFVDKDKNYTSNNPLDHMDYDNAPFDTHRMAKWNIRLTIDPGQRIMDRPDGIRYIKRPNMPTVALGFEQGFASDYDYQRIDAGVRQNTSFKNKGELQIHLKGGKFFHKNDLAFMDYKHFNGNQTHVGSSTGYLNRFMILPYYANSTDDSYFETHAEHHFKGFLLNKIPLINKLGFSEIIGHHHFSIPNKPSYHELTIGLDNIGWGKFRPFRLDYIKSFQDGVKSDGIVLGLKFLTF